MSGDPRPARADGFSLVELLMVMVVIGVLAGIAIPVNANQRDKAADAGTRLDTQRPGKRVAASFLEVPTPPTVRILSGRFDVSGDDVGAVTSGVVIAGASATLVDTTGWTSTAWCLALTNPDGNLKTFRFSAQRGLEAGACSSPSMP
jgi:prepilin-type N-terminal cleavage/methylation domain-containing protein